MDKDDKHLEELVRKARANSQNNQIYMFTAIKTVLADRKSEFTKEEIHSKSCYLHRLFKDMGFIHDYSINGKSRKRAVEEDKVILFFDELVKQIDGYIYRMDHPELRSKKKTGNNVGRNPFNVLTSIDDYCSGRSLSKSYQKRIRQTEYSKLVNQIVLMSYLEDEGVDYNRIMSRPIDKKDKKSRDILLYVIGAKKLAVGIAKRFKEEFIGKDYINSEEKVLQESKIKTDIRTYLENVLPDYLHEFKKNIDAGKH